MSEWREVLLGDLCERVTVGHVGRMATQYVEQGVPFLRSQNVRPFVINRKGLLFIGDDFNAKLRKSSLAAGDVVVVRTGYPGTASVIPEDLDGANCADLVVITPSDRLNPHVLAGLFNSVYGQQTVKSQLVGSAQQHFNVGSAKAMKVRLPDRVGQDRIADILCSLNDLIENNRRRVEVLEAMARAIYRQWFVKFGYPGHADVPVVDSPLGPIPEGWTCERVDSLLFLQRGFDLPQRDRKAGPIPIIGASGVQGSHSAPRAPGPGVTTGRSGTVGAVTYVPGEFWPLNTALWVKEFRLATPRYAFFLLEDLELKRVASGAAVPTLDRKVVHALPAVCPPKALIQRWDAAIVPMFETVDALRAQSDRVVSLRDLLLPRLMSGQIEVSTLDLDGLIEGQVA